RRVALCAVGVHRLGTSPHAAGSPSPSSAVPSRCTSSSLPPRPPSSTLFPYTTLFRSAFNVISAAFSSHFDVKHVVVVDDDIDVRSEEHTSELQSHLNLVCRLLLEKKKLATVICTAATDTASTCSPAEEAPREALVQRA